MKITTQQKLVLSLASEEKDFLNRMSKFANQFDDLCTEADRCEGCPLQGACRVIGGDPQRIRDFAQSLLDAST